MIEHLKLVQSHFKMFQAQTVAYHGLLDMQSFLQNKHQQGTCGRSPLSTEYKLRLLEFELAEREDTLRKDTFKTNLLSCVDKDGCLMDLATVVQPYLQLLIKSVSRRCWREQALLVLILRRTGLALKKRRKYSLVLEKLVRWGGLEVLKAVVNGCLQHQQHSQERANRNAPLGDPGTLSKEVVERAVSELLVATLKALVLLPVDIEAVKDSNMARFLSTVSQAFAAAPDSSETCKEIHHHNVVVPRLVQIVTNKWAEFSRSTTQRRREVKTLTTAAARPPPTLASPVAAAAGEQTRIGEGPSPALVELSSKVSGGQIQEGAEETLGKRPRQASAEEAEVARARRVDLRKRGRGGGIQVVPSSAMASAPAPVEVERESGPSASAPPHPDTPPSKATPITEAAPPGGSTNDAPSSKRRRSVRWRDEHGDGQLREVFVFEKEAGEEDAPASASGGRSWTELAKREHLNERAALQKTGGMSGKGDDGSLKKEGLDAPRKSSDSPSRTVPWHLPPRLAVSDPPPELESTEVFDETARTRVLIERQYLHEDEIPYTPHEDKSAVARASPGAPPAPILEVIPWAGGAVEEKRQKLAAPAPPAQSSLPAFSLPPPVVHQGPHQAPPSHGLLSAAPKSSASLLDNLLQGVRQGATPDVLGAFLSQPPSSATPGPLPHWTQQQPQPQRLPPPLAPAGYQQPSHQGQPSAQLLASLLLGSAQGGGWAPPSRSANATSLLGPSSYEPTIPQGHNYEQGQDQNHRP
ncbi:hypothetical protein Naga_100034g8 [Nannochloropsis gaditana]|uniref:Uncharacterized protein n=1 Tax=Nannochloropsis gaditana TaxID=72520 RepID=W7TKS6_9STRA|nr:hypothetical protein Naga_100034g8 [Nannochloropsis gaditana]